MSIHRLHLAIIALLAMLPASMQGQDTSLNYVKTATMLDAGGTDSLLAVQYYDGLGRPTATVATAGADGGAACTLKTYDGLDRERRSYLPVPAAGFGCPSEDGVSAAAHDFYHDGSCFTQSHYDALGRVTAVDIAGDAWAQDSRQDRTEHLANTEADEVLHYEAPDDGSYALVMPEDASFRYYPAGSLSKTVAYDADGKSVAVFTDLTGRKVLERTDAGDTYYVYNDLGQLRFVLTPAFNAISRSKTLFAYEYRYDDRGRVIRKTLPKDGAQGIVIQYWYDKADRMAYARDPALGSRYRFYLYDGIGRLCVQGTCSGGNQSKGILSTTAYAAGSGGICGTGYAAPYTISDPRLEIVNYYDSYDFLGRNLTDAVPAVTVGQGQRQHAAGFLTGKVVYATNGEALGTVSLYDRKGQVVRTMRKGLGGHVEDVATAYTFTGATDSTVANVTVGYGGVFRAVTAYTYSHGRKTAMALSVCHGLTPKSRATAYAYDAVGRLTGKERQLTGAGHSDCSYAYDVHGWPVSIGSGGFLERLYYADGLGGGCYNGNVSTVKWKHANDSYKGYNLTYDGCNRLRDAAYGSGADLGSYRGYFDEHVEYDANGNIVRLRRGGLTDNMHGGFGLVDDLYMAYTGNMLTGVRDDATHAAYAAATDFHTESRKKSYPLTYNGAGSLVSDAGRNIARIDYDRLNNPVRIQFTNGSVTRYVYSATGEKLRTVHLTAVPNISVPLGGSRELAPSEIQHADSTDYLLGGTLTLLNGRIDKYRFDEGYCQAARRSATQDVFTVLYYDRDHLGNIRQVTKDDGTQGGRVVQRMSYYPFGAQFCDGTSDGNIQTRRYNGKELDRMHGLNTYDYGARHYNPVTARWDRVDPLCEKYYSISPYAYCHNNPIMRIDPDGMDDIFDEKGQFIERTNKGSSVLIKSGDAYNALSSFDYCKTNNIEMLKKVATHYIGMSDKNVFSVNVDNDQNTPEGATLGNIQGTENYFVVVQNGKIETSLDNMYNFENMAYHESLHSRLKITYGGNIGETNAVLLQTMHSSWPLTSASFKLSQANYAASGLNKSNYSSIIKNIYVNLLNQRFNGIVSFSLDKGSVMISKNILNDVIITNNK